MFHFASRCRETDKSVQLAVVVVVDVVGSKPCVCTSFSFFFVRCELAYAPTKYIYESFNTHGWKPKHTRKNWQTINGFSFHDESHEQRMDTRRIQCHDSISNAVACVHHLIRSQTIRATFEWIIYCWLRLPFVVRDRASDYGDATIIQSNPKPRMLLHLMWLFSLSLLLPTSRSNKRRDRTFSFLLNSKFIETVPTKKKPPNLQ